VGILASALDAKLCSLSADVDQMAADMSWMSAEAGMTKEREARRAIRKLAVRREFEP